MICVEVKLLKPNIIAENNSIALNIIVEGNINAKIYSPFIRWQIFYLPKRSVNATTEALKYKGLTSEQLNATNTGVEVHVENQGTVLALTLTGTMANVCFLS